jgi:fructose-1,6-bisphosphatase/inositol monophosphatase family enzyme
MRTRVACRLARFRSTTSLRCAAQEYRLAITGDCHVLMYNKLMPWDHAAGWLLHREAGGYSAHYDGTPYRPTQRSGGLLFAPDEASWRAVRDAVLGDGA